MLCKNKSDNQKKKKKFGEINLTPKQLNKYITTTTCAEYNNG